MLRMPIPTFCLITAFALLPAAAVAADETGFVPLFDGKSLAGWSGNAEMWTVEDGAIVGQTDGNIPDNTFLIHEKEFGDFELRLQFRLYNHKGNSGIQFRSQQRPDYVMSGYQADIADNQFMGILYEEKGRGILARVADDKVEPMNAALRRDGWNDYTITARGNHITLDINGVTTVDFRDEAGARKGLIGLQLHRNHDMKIGFRNIRIRPLD